MNTGVQAAKIRKQLCKSYSLGPEHLCLCLLEDPGVLDRGVRRFELSLSLMDHQRPEERLRELLRKTVGKEKVVHLTRERKGTGDRGHECVPLSSPLEKT